MALRRKEPLRALSHTLLSSNAYTANLQKLNLEEWAQLLGYVIFQRAFRS